MTDLAWLSVAEGSQLLRARKLSPVEWTKALLDRIAAVDPAYNAFLVVTADRALAQAKSRRSRDRRRQVARPDARRALCREGHLRRRGHGDHLPFQDPHRTTAPPPTRS